MKRKQTKKIAHLAILAALSVVFYMFLKFPLPFFPSFLDIQFSNLPVILAGFVFGPLEACIICVIRFLVKAPATSTALVGETADLIIGCLVGITTSVIYKKIHTKKGGIIALVVGSIVWVGAACIANGFILIPWYMKTYGENAVLGMLSYMKGINEHNYMLYYILFAVIPFNLLLATIVSLITFFVYKRVSGLYNREFNESEEEQKKNYDSLIIGSAIIIMDLGTLIATIIFKKSSFIVTDSHPVIEVVMMIVAYVVVALLGVFLIVKNVIKNKKI